MSLSRNSTRSIPVSAEKFWRWPACYRCLGPQLGRPRVNTLKGSRHANMKELRCSAADGEWRLAFAFDPRRRAILLVAGDKSGVGERRFYRELIRKADQRFAAHLARMGKGSPSCL